MFPDFIPIELRGMSILANGQNSLNCSEESCNNPFADNYFNSQDIYNLCSEEVVKMNSHKSTDPEHIWKSEIICICKTCGKDFIGARIKNPRFCSNKCYGVSISKPKEVLICKTCGNNFLKRDSGTNEYCSNQCIADDKRVRPKSAICINCGTEFEPSPSSVGKYCSNICVGKHHTKNNHYKYNIQDRTRICKYCGNQFIVHYANSPEIYCSTDCYGAAHSRENHHHWNPESARIRYPVAFNTHLRRYIRNRDNRTCQMCQKTEKETGKRLDVHHIDLNKINNNSSNLISLCSTCHAHIHNRINSWQEHFRNIAELNEGRVI